MERKDECKRMAENLIKSVCSLADCEMPQNTEQIVDSIVQDVEDTADPVEWHSGDVGIAFRRWMESNAEF